METTFTQLISSLGFPIVVAGWLFYERYKFNIALTRTLQKVLDMLAAIEKKL